MAQKKRQLIGCLFFMEAAGRRGKFEGVLPFNQSRCPIGHKKTADFSDVRRLAAQGLGGRAPVKEGAPMGTKKNS